MVFGVRGWGMEVWSLGVWVWGLGFEIWGLGTPGSDARTLIQIMAQLTNSRPPQYTTYGLSGTQHADSVNCPDLNKLPGKGIQTPMAQGRSTKIIAMIKWIRASRLSIKKSISRTCTARCCWDRMSSARVDGACSKTERTERARWKTTANSAMMSSEACGYLVARSAT